MKHHFRRERVAVTDVVFDAGTQIRVAINEQTVGDYAERMTEGVEFPPIVLFHDGVRYYLADGFHRTLAAKRNQFHDIEADVETGTRADALWFALGANKANACQMTKADKKHAIVLALKAFPDKSQTIIAEQIGVNQHYVGEVKKQVSATTNLPDRVTGKDGKSYPAARHAHPQADEIGRRLVAGESVHAIAKALRVAPESVSKVRKALGLKFVDKSKAAIADRRAAIRQMAADGFSSRQMAAELGLTEVGCREIIRTEGIDVPADLVTKNMRRHDPNRIVERMVMDAENLCADVNLIEFDALDRERLPEWLDSLKTSRAKLVSFIGRLMKEQQKHGEAA